jgi:hypothetical protein
VSARRHGLHHPLLDRNRFGARAWLQTVRCEAVDNPLEAERNRRQHLPQPGQFGPDDVIQLQDLPLLACDNEEIPLRDHEHAAWQAPLQREVHNRQAAGLEPNVEKACGGQSA